MNAAGRPQARPTSSPLRRAASPFRYDVAKNLSGSCPRPRSAHTVFSPPSTAAAVDYASPARRLEAEASSPSSRRRFASTGGGESSSACSLRARSAGGDFTSQTRSKLVTEDNKTELSTGDCAARSAWCNGEPGAARTLDEDMNWILGEVTGRESEEAETESYYSYSDEDDGTSQVENRKQGGALTRGPASDDVGCSGAPATVSVSSGDVDINSTIYMAAPGGVCPNRRRGLRSSSACVNTPGNHASQLGKRKSTEGSTNAVGENVAPVAPALDWAVHASPRQSRRKGQRVGC